MIKRLWLLLLLCPLTLRAAPAITVSASAVTLLGTSQSISITVQLVDPNNTGMLKVSGTGIVPIMRATTVTPGTTATVGPIYGNDVILDGFGNSNTTYYIVQVFTVNGGFISSTPSLQNFYAFTGSGTVDLSTATPLAPSFFSGPSGSVVVPGSLTVSGTGTIGNGASMAAFTFSNHNGLTWAIAPAGVTIDQAVSGCTTLGVSSACISHISPGYTGAESTNLLTLTNLGYKVYTGSAVITDYRNNQVFGAPMYGIIYGGRTGGALNRMGVVNYCSSPVDSCAGTNSWNILTGTWPTNGGLQAAAIDVLALDNTQTVGTSTAELSGHDTEVHIDTVTATNGDPVFHSWAYVGGNHFSRSGATQNVDVAATFKAKVCTDDGTGAPARFLNCYGFDGDAPTLGVNRNFAYHSSGNFMFENAQGIYAGDAPALAAITNITESNQTITVTLTGACPATFVSGMPVGITGNTQSAFNTQVFINPPGCSASVFTAFVPGTNGAATGTGGNAQPSTARPMMIFDSSNFVDFKPLVDTNGWQFQTQAAVNILAIKNTGIIHSQNILPLTDGAVGLGTGTNHEGFLWIGNGGANFGYLLSPNNAAANRTVNIPDAAATTTLGLSYNATTAVYQSKRAVAGCTTAASIGGTCATDITVTWGTAFADANYSVTCTGSTPTAVPAAPFVVSGTKLAATVHINYFAITAVAASYATIDCIAVHD